MTKQELEQELEQKIEQLQKQLDELKKVKEKKWIPAENELYYFVSDNLEVHNADNTNRSFFDIPRIEIGNCFKTKEEAQFVSDKIKYTLMFKHYVEEHNEPLDWEDVHQPKWFIYYNYTMHYVDYDIYIKEKQQGSIYATSKQIIEDAIAYIGKDNVKKYILEVED